MNTMMPSQQGTVAVLLRTAVFFMGYVTFTWLNLTRRLCAASSCKRDLTTASLLPHHWIPGRLPPAHSTSSATICPTTLHCPSSCPPWSAPRRASSVPPPPCADRCPHTCSTSSSSSGPCACCCSRHHATGRTQSQNPKLEDYFKYQMPTTLSSLDSSSSIFSLDKYNVTQSSPSC